MVDVLLLHFTIISKLIIFGSEMDKFVTVTRKRSAQNENESSSAGNRDKPSSSSGRKGFGSICIAEDEADNESVMLMSDKDLGARKSKQYKRCFQQA